MAIYELGESRQNQQEQNGGARAERRFLVESNCEQAATQPGIPSLGSSFTFGTTSMIARQYVTESTGTPSMSILRVLYDNDGTYRGPGNLDDRDPKFKSYEISVNRTIEEIPAFRGRYVQVGAEERELLWEREDLKQDSYEVNLQVRLNLSTWTMNQIMSVTEQVNKIHKFGGLRWRYVGGDATNEEPHRWHVTHNWVHDPGTIPPDGDEMGRRFGGTAIIPRVVRESFGQWFVKPRDTPYGQPSILVIPPFNVKEDGYLNLPGSPIP